MEKFINKEIKYDKECDRIVVIFSELTNIITTIKNEFEQENKQDPGLTMEIVIDRLEMVSSYEKSFLGYKKRSKSDWSLEKYIQHSVRYLYSFFRAFDNPFLGSHKWYQRIVELVILLSAATDELESIIKRDS